MHDKNSLYAINKKDAHAIVYPEGRRFCRLTEGDMDLGCDFCQLKAWSDANYHMEEKKKHVEDNHSVSLESLTEGAIFSIGPEAELEQIYDRAQRKTEARQKVDMIRSLLSEKQFHRLWRSCVDGIAEKDIALSEGTSQQAVSKSISQAKKKIRKYFSQEE